MSHRSGKTSRRTCARDPRLLLVAGVALVLTALAMSTCGPPEDLLGSSLVMGPGLACPPEGDQA